jgi:hypothetical protein
MSALRIHVDPTLPPERFNAELLAASRLARLERVARRLRAKRAEEGFRRMGYEPEAVRELVAIHVHGVAA